MKLNFQLHLLVLYLCCCFSIVAGAQPINPGPDEITRMTVDEIMTDMRDNQVLYTANRADLDAMVEKRLIPRFNFKVMTQLAVGKYWQGASPEQKAALEQEFRILLVRTYSNLLFSNLNNLYSNRNESASVHKSNIIKNGDAIVELVLDSDTSESASLVLRMRRNQEDWKVIDVSYNGISLIVSYRASFVREIGHSGLDGMIASLTTKNRANRANLK
jgi:phospholipid transport system substrate-binding protein